MPDAVHAGSLTTAAFEAASAGLGPLVSVSWAFDVLREAIRDPGARGRIDTAVRNSRVIVVDSLAVESEIRREYNPSAPIVRFPWGTDLTLFRPAPRDHGAEISIVSARAWEPMYRVPDALRAFAAAREVDDRIQLRLFGAGSMEAEIAKLITALDIGDQVDLPGRSSEADLAAHLSVAGVYLTMSEVDGTSVTLLQALACGLPIVATDIPGNREWLENSPGARMVPVGDWRAAGRAIVDLLHFSPVERMAIQQRHRSIAEERADWSVNQAKLLHAYDMARNASRSIRDSGS